MPLIELSKYSNFFVETGTLNGAGIIKALNAGYTKIISIELDEYHYKKAKENFKENTNVEIINGDSGLVLGNAIKNIDEHITFFLDGHYSGEGTAFGINEFPILEELNHIKNHHIKTHTILIDDIRLLKNYNNVINIDTMKLKVLEINKDYKFDFIEGYVQNDIMLCYV